MAAYKTLFEISLKHTFFTDNVCKGISMLPNQSTKNFFYNACLTIQTTTDKLTVLYNSDFTLPLQAYANENPQLIFSLVQNNRLFFSYTDLEHIKNQILVFNSASTHAHEGLLLLNNSDFVSKTDLKDIPADFPRSKEANANIVNAIGMVTINLSDLLTSNSLAGNSSPRYAIQFKARQTYWRYNIIQKNNKDFDKLIIKDNRQTIQFSTGNNQISLSNGVQSTQIISTQPIQQSQAPHQDFELVGIRNNKESVLIKQLGTPDIKNISKENDKRISEIYIYC